MVIVEQCDQYLTLRRGEQTLVLPLAAAAQQLGAALTRLGVTARGRRADQAAPHPHTRSTMIDDTPDERAALAAEIAADPTPLDAIALAALGVYAEGWEQARRRLCRVARLCPGLGHWCVALSSQH